MRLQTLLTVASTIALSPLASAQVTSKTISIATPTAQSCQNDNGALTGGAAASADIEFTFDAGTSQLELTVTNTSPDPAERHALTGIITAVHFNAPRAVTGLQLVSKQTEHGRRQLPWTFEFDGRRDIRAGCFKTFRARLRTIWGSYGGIANADARRSGGRCPIQGPVTFTFDVETCGTVNAESFAHAFNLNSFREPASVAIKVQSAGVCGQESGFLANGGTNFCATSMFTIGTPCIGNTIQFCQSGPVNCHDCVWVSTTPGPSIAGPYVLPIGLPALFIADLGFFDETQEFCVSIDVPDDPSLIGESLFFAVATYPEIDPSDSSVGCALEVTVQAPCSDHPCKTSNDEPKRRNKWRRWAKRSSRRGWSRRTRSSDNDD